LEINYSDLKKKKVINILDGKVLGFVTDVIFTFPEGKIKAFIACDNKAVFFKEEKIICLSDVNKIGDDAVLVCVKECPKKCRKDENACEEKNF